METAYRDPIRKPLRRVFGIPLRRPPQETPSGEHSVSPSGDPLRRLPMETPSGDPLRRIIIDSGDCLRTPLRRAFCIPLRRAFSYTLRRPPSGESVFTPSKHPLRRAKINPLRRAFVDSLRRIVISKFYYLCSSSLVYRTAGWLSGLRRWKERGCENGC